MHAEYAPEGSDGGRQAGKKPNGTYDNRSEKKRK
jgi:hypothetical protein